MVFTRLEAAWMDQAKVAEAVHHALGMPVVPEVYMMV